MHDWHDFGVEAKYEKICYDLSWKARNSKHLYWDNILKIVQNSACDKFPGSRSCLMKDLIFSSDMFLEIGYGSKMIDWQFFLSHNILWKVLIIKITSDEKFLTSLRRRS